MEQKYTKQIVDIFSNDLPDEALKKSLLLFHPYEISNSLSKLTKDQRLRIYKILEPSEMCKITSFLEKDMTLKYFDEMTPKYIVNIIQNLQIDDAVDIMKAMPKDERAAYLKLMDEKHQNKIKNLIHFKEDSAGSIMTTEYVEIKEKDIVAEAMKKLIEQAVNATSISTLYVVDENDILVGTLSLREIILARKTEKIKDIMNKRIITVNTSSDQEDVAEIFKDYDFKSLPVIDRLNRMLGIITIDDIVDVIELEATEDYFKLAGVNDNVSSLKKETIILGVKKRLPWLLVLSVLGFLTSTIISSFDDTLDAAPILALFIPMVLGMAGNTGTQALAVTVRGLSDNQLLEKKGIYNHLLRELGIGVFNGLLLGTIIFFTTYIFLLLGDNTNELRIAEVVSISIFVSLIVSTFAGAFIPIIINTLNIDPAVASGPFVSVVNDIIAVSVYFTLATILILKI